jgi:membrane protein YdbS with pleckstrin-like domain
MRGEAAIMQVVCFCVLPWPLFASIFDVCVCVVVVVVYIYHFPLSVSLSV